MSTTIKALTREDAPAAATRVMDQLTRSLGRVPNMYAVMANSPAVLEAYTSFSNSLRKGSIGAPLEESIAIGAAAYNNCEYCLSAHSYLGARNGLSGKEIADATTLTAQDPKAAAALEFTQKILSAPATLSLEDADQLRNNGFTDGEILEIIANVVRNMFTNYLNVVAGTVNDWPPVNQTVAHENK
ncbi:MAG TPA: carboxymuconolactone decarboxylase family protein [Chitinophaga sp.]|uniref:carboxymuconolactone decarboxylase family protein n=1 Tax=Chitinophaga sp. TaxID=1869181 RepID=UPI002BC4D201|nr:carboxymuconolactone decarboxylase family protein [Chitinophaga sp.]HVI47299.1 carboxymuconolactone decarboxylase family protein [Chitinophaga sp.]